MGDGPVKKFRSGGLEVCVWKGEKSYSLTFQKKYKAKDGAWKESKSIWPSEGLVLGGMLQAAYEWIEWQGDPVVKGDSGEADVPY